MSSKSFFGTGGLSLFLLFATPLTPSPLAQGLEQNQTILTTVAADLMVYPPLIFIDGENFGPAPVVFLGVDMGQLAPLIVTSASPNSIVAELPTSEPGSYVLAVQNGEGANGRVILDVTIHTPEPEPEPDPEPELEPEPTDDTAVLEGANGSDEAIEQHEPQQVAETDASDDMKQPVEPAESMVLGGAKDDPGMPGPQGAPGADGVDGVSGWELVSSSNLIHPGHTVAAFARCPPGKKPLGGGWFGPSTADVNLKRAEPDDFAYNVVVENVSTIAQPIRITAICATIVP